MSQRTNIPAVKKLLGRNYDTRNLPDCQQFIDYAVALTDYVESQDTDSIMSSTSLELVERWLSCHGYAIMDLLFHEEEAESSRGKYQGKTEMALSATLYGQQAMVLDLTGTLAALNQTVLDGKKPKVGIIWLGTPYEDDE